MKLKTKYGQAPADQPTADKCLLKKLNEQIKKKSWMNKLNKSQNVFRHLPSNHPLTKLQARFSSSPVVDLPSPTPESNYKH